MENQTFGDLVFAEMATIDGELLLHSIKYSGKSTKFDKCKICFIGRQIKDRQNKIQFFS